MSCSGCGAAGACGCAAALADSAFTSADDLDLDCTLLAGLSGVVDSARDIPVQMGLVPYSAWLVHTRWSGGTRGRGVEEVVRERQLLPTPMVSEVSSLVRQLLAGGRDEQGTVRARGISVARYTEDELLGRGVGGQPVPKDQNFYWELRFPQREGGPILRKFTVSGSPERKMGNLEWVVDLVRASEDRARNGQPQG